MANFTEKTDKPASVKSFSDRVSLEGVRGTAVGRFV